MSDDPQMTRLVGIMAQRDEQERRDEIARDVAREWVQRRAILAGGRPIPVLVPLVEALDRLVAAHGITP